MTATDRIRTLTCVFHERACVGFLLNRGRDGVEAFNTDDRSLGTFADEQAAAVAIFTHKSVTGAP
jgi:hypothetical protein